MAGLKELNEKLKAAPELAEEFKEIKSVDELIAKAKEHGFEITKEEIAEASNVSPEELSNAAGGAVVLVTADWIVSVKGFILIY